MGYLELQTLNLFFPTAVLNWSCFEDTAMDIVAE